MSGGDLFVANYGGYGLGTIGEYTTSGATVNSALITGLDGPIGIAVSGGNLFITSILDGTIGEYTTSGVTVNAARHRAGLPRRHRRGVDTRAGDMGVASDRHRSAPELWVACAAPLNGSFPPKLDRKGSLMRLESETLMKIVLATVFFVLPFCNLASGSELYWTGFGGNDDITSANLDGTNIQTLVPGLGYPDEPFALAIDSNTQKMYWTDASGGRIQTANLDGSDRQTILTGGELRGIAIDSATQQLFFTDVHGSVESVNLDGTDRQTLITGLASPINIVLDVPDGKMYFSQTDSNQIDEANLDGSDMHAIISTGLNRPEGLALRSGRRKNLFYEQR